MLLLGGLALGLYQSSQEDWVDVAFPGAIAPFEPVMDPEPAPSLRGEVLPGEESEDPEEEEWDSRAQGDDLRRDLLPVAVVRQIPRDQGQLLRVVEKATGAPVVGALVLYYDSLSPGYHGFRQARGLYRKNPELVLREHGEQLLTNEAGLAVLPYGLPRQMVCVRFGALWSQVQLQKVPPADGYLVQLEPDEHLQVQVVDAQDQPLSGMALTFNIQTASKAGPPYWLLLRDAGRRGDPVPGAVGLLLYRHSQVSIQAMRAAGMTGSQLQLGIDAPGLSRCGPILHLNQPLPSEPVKIIRPATGSIVVQVLDSDGEPVQRKLRLQKAQSAEYFDLQQLPDKERAKRIAKWESQTDALGQVRFDNVALGLDFQVQSLGKNITEGEQQEFHGPREDGEVVQVQLTKTFNAVTLWGVAMDGRGELLKEQSLQFYANAKGSKEDSKYLRQGKLSTESDGSFQLRLPMTAGKENRYGKLYLRLAEKEGAQPHAITDIPPQLTAGPYSLGNIRLLMPPVVASGTMFVDDKPELNLRRLRVEQSNGKGGWDRAPRLRVYAKGEGAKGEGGYEIRGEVGNQVLRLRAVRAWSFLPIEPLNFVQGQTNLDVHLRRGGSLRAIVLHDVDVADVRMELWLEPIGMDPALLAKGMKGRMKGWHYKRRSGERSQRRLYNWSGLQQGTYQMTLRLQGAAVPFVTLTDLLPQFDLPSSEVAPVVINLRGLLRALKVQAVDAKNRRLAGMIFPLQPTGLGTVEGVKMGGKGGRLHTTAQSMDLQVVVKGYRPKILYGVRGEVKARMEPGIPVTVNLDKLKLPKGISLQIRLDRQAEQAATLYRNGMANSYYPKARARTLAQIMGEQHVDLRRRGGRNWKATLMQPGKFRLTFRLYRNVDKGKRGLQLKGGYEPRQLQVQDQYGEQKFAVKLSPKKLQEAVQRLQEMVKKDG